jgi:hypothetical protein
MASSISCGVRPYSSASAAMDSRALQRDAIITVEIFCSCDNWLAEADQGVDLDGLGLGKSEVFI